MKWLSRYICRSWKNFTTFTEVSWRIKKIPRISEGLFRLNLIFSNNLPLPWPLRDQGWKLQVSRCLKISWLESTSRHYFKFNMIGEFTTLMGIFHSDRFCLVELSIPQGNRKTLFYYFHSLSTIRHQLFF